MVASNWQEALAECIDDSSESKLNRRAIQVRMGVRPEDAAIIDDAFLDLSKRIIQEIGKEFDGLAVELYPVALSYIMRGVVVNIELVEQLVRDELLRVVMEMGGGVTLVTDDLEPTPGCSCPACLAKIAAREQANATRH